MNFDFHIDQNDPDLRHPVPRRLTPEMVAANVVQTEEITDGIDLNSSKKSEGSQLPVSCFFFKFISCVSKFK